MAASEWTALDQVIAEAVARHGAFTNGALAAAIRKTVSRRGLSRRWQRAQLAGGARYPGGMP